METIEALGGERERKGSRAGREGRGKEGSSASIARIAASPLDRRKTNRSFRWKSPRVPSKRYVYVSEVRDRREVEGKAKSPLYLLVVVLLTPSISISPFVSGFSSSFVPRLLL